MAWGAAQGNLRDADGVTTRGKIGADGIGITAFDLECLHPLKSSAGRPLPIVGPCQNQRCSRQRGVAAGLVRAAHNAERHGDAAAFGQHAGDDGVHGAFAARRFIRVALLQGEACAAVLEVDAEFI